MLYDWNFWFSVITGLTAIIALVLTFIQLHLSNKQSLFDRRLECYLKMDGLFQLYKENQKHFEGERKDEPIFAVDLEFLWLTNNTYLEEVGGSIKKPLENPGHKKFLIKREELKKLAIEAELVFKGSEAKDISLFILAYERLLFKMYQYQIILGKLHEYAEQYHSTLSDAQKGIDEPSYRNNLLEAYTELKTVYLQVEKNSAIKKLKKQIKF